RVGRRARDAERRAGRAGRSVHGRAALRRAADLEPCFVRAGGASHRGEDPDADEEGALRHRSSPRRRGPRLSVTRARLRSRVLLLTAAFALALFTITFGLSWRAKLAQEKWTRLVAVETAAVA